MKRIIVVLALISAIIIAPMEAKSSSIDLISQSCRIWGIAWYYSDNLIFDKSSITQVSVTDPIYGWLGSASNNVGQSVALLESFSAEHDPAYASAGIIFRPIGASHINIFAEVAVDYAYQAEVYLIDLTTSEELLRLESNITKVKGAIIYDDITNLYNQYQGLFPVDPSHEYSLITFAGGEVVNNFARANISLVSVPEPATLLLLGLGLMGMLGIRRGIKK